MTSYTLSHTGEQIDKALNYLIESTGDNTDRTSEIQTALNTYKNVKLGTGVFYVTGIVMSDICSLVGSGESTVLILAQSVTNGSAIKLWHKCSVSDMAIAGVNAGASPIDISSETVGTRNGILFEKVAGSQLNSRCTIRHCLIYGFSGGAIKCNETSTGSQCCINASDCFIYNCGAGIYIPYLSEYSRFTNITVNECHYGCIDNGGNNNFANCSFSENIMGILMDNSDGTKTNNAHGSFVGCTFNHHNNNTGIAIKAIKMDTGEVFSGCQIAYGEVYISGCYGFVFDGCNFINGVTITITDASTVTFSDDYFGNSIQNPTISGGAGVYVKNCRHWNGKKFNIYRRNILDDIASKDPMSVGGLTLNWNETTVPNINRLETDTPDMWEAVIDGTMTLQHFTKNILYDESSLHGLVPGNKYRVEMENDLCVCSFGVWAVINGNLESVEETGDSYTFTLPQNATGILLRVNFWSNTYSTRTVKVDKKTFKVALYA